MPAENDKGCCLQMWEIIRGCCCLGSRPPLDKPLFQGPLGIVTMKDNQPVTHPIPDREYREWSAKVKYRYICQIACCTLISKCQGCCESTEPVSDAELSHLFNFTILSTFLNPTLDPKDLVAFKDILPAGYAEQQKHRLTGLEQCVMDCSVIKENKMKDTVRYYKCDYSAMSSINPIPGTYTAQCIGLFSREGTLDIDPLTPVAISVNGSIITPKDAQAWELAKTYLLTGAVYDILYVDHPSNAHLPLSVMNGYTKTILPQNHPLFQLLEPHFYLHLGVNDSVRFGKLSVALMEEETVYNCFTFHGEEEALKFFSVGVTGIEGNSSYIPYKFTPTPRKIESLFGRFLRSFYPEVMKFVEAVLAGVSEKDPVIIQWADSIAPYLKGFPTGLEFSENRSLLIQCVTKIIWLECVEHSTTHHSFGAQLPRKKIPFRIRVPPPSTNMPPVDWKRINNATDRAEAILAWRMFFIDHPVTHLVSINYKFTDQRLVNAARQFREDLQKLEELWGDLSIIPVKQIAASVQF